MMQPFVHPAASGKMGSNLTFAACAHEINVKSKGERRLCGLFSHSLHLREWPI